MKKRRRKGRVLCWRGKCQSLADWAIDTGLNASTIRSRLERGMPRDAALTLPPVSASERAVMGKRASGWVKGGGR